jgi:hypothetical protein
LNDTDKLLASKLHKARVLNKILSRLSPFTIKGLPLKILWTAPFCVESFSFRAELLNPIKDAATLFASKNIFVVPSPALIRGG